jgi:hypothetical protein
MSSWPEVLSGQIEPQFLRVNDTILIRIYRLKIFYFSGCIIWPFSFKYVRSDVIIRFGILQLKTASISHIYFPDAHSCWDSQDVLYTLWTSIIYDFWQNLKHVPILSQFDLFHKIILFKFLICFNIILLLRVDVPRDVFYPVELNKKSENSWYRSPYLTGVDQTK